MIKWSIGCVILLTFMGCAGESLPLEGTNWSSLAKQVGENEIPEGLHRFRFASDGRFAHELGPRKMSGTYRASSATLRLRYDSKAIWDPGTAVEYRVTFLQDQMVLHQTGGDGPAHTTMGRVIELKRAE